jgi:two-component system LytT family sensor kinase
VEFCYLIFIAANFYFNISITIPKFLYRQKYIIFGLLFLSGIIVTALLRVPLATWLNLHYFIPGKTQPGFKALFLKSFINIFIWVICLVTAKLIIDRVRFQQYIESIKKEKSKTELDFLQAQFNPHFLFNSINSIYGHIDKKNVAARHMLLTFSDMLRYQLYECNTETIGIDKEINYIKNYIALQRSRMEESLVVNFSTAENISGFKIAPLLFMAFIENAFKYVSNSDAFENRIEITFKKINDELIFRSYNTKEQRNNKSIGHSGIGIANVKRRLELLYTGKYDLSIKAQEESYEAILKLQLS